MSNPKKISIRRSGDSWLVSLPPFGFAPPSRVPFDSYDAAVLYASGEVARRVQPHSLSASLDSEVWGPWTMKRGRQ